VNTSSASLLSKRVLSLNVGFLLSAGPGNDKTVQLNISDAVRIADDLIANRITGQLRLSRTKEGILVQSKLDVAVNQECARCLETFEHIIPIEIEELYASPQPIGDTEFFVGQNAQLDLAPLLRAEVLIALSHRQYCREDCQGLCTYCGTNLNYENCECEAQAIDPRMAKLKELLDAGD
jgi:DUF177 domain-containing protein